MAWLLIFFQLKYKTSAYKLIILFKVILRYYNSNYFLNQKVLLASYFPVRKVKKFWTSKFLADQNVLAAELPKYDKHDQKGWISIGGLLMIDSILYQGLPYCPSNWLSQSE